MLNIRLWVVGGLREKFFAEAAGEYARRLTKYCKFEVFEIKESTVAKETEELRSRMVRADGAVKGYVFLCDVGGGLVTSLGLAKKLEKISAIHSTVNFIVGGSNGVGAALDSLIGAAGEKISFGKITLPHQLFRVVLTEQIYRAFTILKGEKYHK